MRAVRGAGSLLIAEVTVASPATSPALAPAAEGYTTTPRRVEVAAEGAISSSTDSRNGRYSEFHEVAPAEELRSSTTTTSTPAQPRVGGGGGRGGAGGNASFS